MWRQTEQSQLLISLAAFEGDIFGYCNSSFMLIPNYFQTNKREVAAPEKRKSLHHQDDKMQKPRIREAWYLFLVGGLSAEINGRRSLPDYNS